jgi:hypothetical protein
VARLALHRTSLALLAVLAPLALGASLLCLAPREARADDDQANGTQPVAYSARPLTLPALTLAPSATATLDKLSTTTAAKIYTQNPKSLNVQVALAASIGIIENIEVGAVFAPLQVLPKFAYGDPSVHGTFRFVKGAFELAAFAGATFITHNAPDPELTLPVLGSSAGVLLQPGLLARVHMGGKAKLDVSATVPIQLGSDIHDVGLNIPVELAINLFESFHIGASTGFGIANVKAPALNSYVPLGLIAGLAFGGEKGPVVDVDGLFRFPQFINPGASDKIDAQDFTAGLGVTVYLYFL